VTDPRPEPSPDLLGTRGVAPDLERLASAAARGDGADVIERVKLVPGRLRIARASDRHAGALDESGWHAARVREGTRARDVTCWTVGREPATVVYGRWTGQALEFMHVQAGDRFWAVRQTSTGQSFLSTDESIEGPADRKLFEDVARRIREEPARWELLPTGDEWNCPRCSWPKQRSGPCEFCGIAGDPWAVERPSAQRRLEAPASRVAGRSAELELLDEYDELLDRLVADLTGMPSPVRPPGPQTDDDSVAGSIVLEGFDRSRQAAVIRAVMEARKMSGDEPADLVHVTSLVEEATPVICAGIAARHAATIQRWLARAGAETRFRRDA
jgi:hypothetical protein